MRVAVISARNDGPELVAALTHHTDNVISGSVVMDEPYALFESELSSP